ncbi:hypothetical protein KUCAC02_018787, partial [Chaenocephalus aceratus]
GYRQGRDTPRKYIEPSSTTPWHGCPLRVCASAARFPAARSSPPRGLGHPRPACLGPFPSLPSLPLGLGFRLLILLYYSIIFLRNPPRPPAVHLVQSGVLRPPVCAQERKNIEGEVVLISGAGSGIGRLMAQEFASLNTVLVLWDINQEGMKETARLAKESGASRVHYYVCDCSNKNEVYRVADQVKREVGDVGILVNNAGIVTGKKFMDAPDSLIEKTMEVNTMAHFWTYKAFLPAMIANNHGHLVSIASFCWDSYPAMDWQAFLPAMISNNHGHLVSIASSAGLISCNGLA